MNHILDIGVGSLLLVALVVGIHNDDWLLAKLRWLKREDKDLQLTNRQIAAGLSAAMLAEAILLVMLDLPLEFNALLGVLSVYLPCTFYLNCVVFHCGARRELIFTCVFLGGCLLSMRMTGWPRLEFLIPLTSLLTTYQCYAASRDPYTHYRKGLRILFRRESPVDALAAFTRSQELGMSQDDRCHFHMARALLAGQRTDEAGIILSELFARRPQFVDDLCQDALFDSCWLEGIVSHELEA